MPGGRGLRQGSAAASLLCPADHLDSPESLRARLPQCVLPGAGPECHGGLQDRYRMPAASVSPAAGPLWTVPAWGGVVWAVSTGGVLLGEGTSHSCLPPPPVLRAHRVLPGLPIERVGGLSGSRAQHPLPRVGQLVPLLAARLPGGCGVRWGGCCNPPAGYAGLGGGYPSPGLVPLPWPQNSCCSLICSRL